MATSTRQSEQPDHAELQELDRVTIKFAGASGDGMQLAGTQFKNAAYSFEWPTFGVRTLTEIAPVRQSQFAQREPDLVEARLVITAPVTAEQESLLRRRILSRLPRGFRLSIVYCEQISRGAGGKYEDFVCEIPES